MQFLQILPDMTLEALSSRIGYRNVEQVLITNGLSRTPNVGSALANVIKQAETTGDVSPQRKISILNTFVQDSDIFEKAALLDNVGWKILSTTGTFQNTLKIPDTVALADADDILGNGVGIGNTVYDSTMKSLSTPPYTIDSAIFNEYSTSRTLRTLEYRTGSSDTYQWFKIPWGHVTLYSSIGRDSVDFPVYPEELSDNRKANYTQMPDLIYQYEPWFLYESSGPRSIPFTFHMHRHLWTGDHNDGKANELIRFCEACCYPKYNGSAVNTDTVTLYIAGKPYISGIMENVDTEWRGPIADDGWYLEFTLKFTITEVSTQALSYEVVRNLPLIGR